MAVPDEAAFERDGFVTVDRLVDPADVPALWAAFDRLFRGEWVAGVEPDEVNWQEATGDPTRTRQVCNGWKAEPAIEAVVRRPDIARMIGRLMGWPGVRLIQDNVLWKPPGAKTLGFHRDDDYSHWYRPATMATCWIALDPTTAAGGTIEYAVGSHRWPPSGPLETAFHAPADYRGDVRTAGGDEVTITPVEVPIGGGSFHHGLTWHGSGENRTDVDRRALVIHCGPADAAYDLENLDQGMGPVYARYCDGTMTMPPEHFPVLWEQN